MTRRSLVLAGGGMRVAWQAGVMVALHEAGLTFGHVDGSSGGTINAAMLLSGLDPDEMSERWITLPTRRFFSPLRPRSYLRGPTSLMSVGDADGIVNHVFPHLGIEIDRIRSRTDIEGSFNVCNFADKTCEAISHDEADLDLLVAGISLPIAMPVVQREGVPYTDVVWIKDANLLEAVKRGADELWLVWCIGNTDRYGAGPFEQYVHMIEMSANGGLMAEFERIAEINERRAERPIRLHVVKPRYPLPLDPVFFLGRIDAHTLCAMGYRDGRTYLSRRTDEGVRLDRDATRMIEPSPGVMYRETLRGVLPGLGGVELRLAATVAGGEGEVVGSVSSASFGGRRWLDGGTVAFEDGRLTYEASAGGQALTVRRRLGRRNLRRVLVSIDGHAAEFQVSARQATRSLLSVEPVGVHGIIDRGRAVWDFASRLRDAPTAQRAS